MPVADEKLDFSLMDDIRDWYEFNAKGLDPEAIVAGVKLGLTMLDDFEVYETVPAHQSKGKHHIATRAEMRMTDDGTLNWRLVAMNTSFLKSTTTSSRQTATA